MLGKLFGSKKAAKQPAASRKRSTVGELRANRQVVRSIHTRKNCEQVPPNSIANTGVTKPVTVCLNCNRTALASMQTDIKPCPSCKGTIARGIGRCHEDVKLFKAKWINGAWESDPTAPPLPYLDKNYRQRSYV